MHVLDNPVYEAFTGRQSHFNLGSSLVAYSAANVSPFIALPHWSEEEFDMLERDVPSDRSYFVLSASKVVLPETFELVFQLPLYQMVCNDFHPSDRMDAEIRVLGEMDVPQMVALTGATKPGPFYERTIDFGNYIGIFDGDRLVSMAGERLRVEGYTEVSAICTDPEYLGRGYASMLLTAASRRIIEAGDVPFLHSRQDNVRAIEVYRRMGFAVRSEIDFKIFRVRN